VYVTLKLIKTHYLPMLFYVRKHI